MPTDWRPSVGSGPRHLADREGGLIVGAPFGLSEMLDVPIFTPLEPFAGPLASAIPFTGPVTATGTPTLGL